MAMIDTPGLGGGDGGGGKKEEINKKEKRKNLNASWQNPE